EESVHPAANAAVDGATGAAESVESLLAGDVEVPVRSAGAYRVEESGHAADRGSVRSSVVVDDDDEVAGVVVADVVQRLPGHPTSQCAVPDDRDDMTVGLPRHLERTRDPVRPTQRTRGVGTFHDVVRRFAPL